MRKRDLTPCQRTIFTVLSALMTVISLTAQTIFEFSTGHRGPVIGPLHYGIFYEEINHAGDGGIYAELIRNGSMEENSSNPDYWWTLGSASLGISDQNLLNGAQKRAMRLRLTKENDGVRNIGYWGINIVKGRKYKASFWVRTDGNWTGDLTLTLESYEGDDLGHTVVAVADAGSWRKYTAEITATDSYQLGWFAIRGSKAGTIYLDCVSLFPPTFKNRENGMRIDLAEKLAALHPRFMRFPGGCYIEGGNRYQWRNTVGPVEERLGLYNSHWGYPVSNGMGFHEFLQLAEDLDAEPLFVCNVGIGHGWYEDYRHIEGYIQEALDAIEYANGDVTTYWGAKRAAAGHPAPFNLRLLEIGNENYNFHSNSNSDQSDHYAERYKQFYEAIKSRYPQMVCIGNVESWGTDAPTWRNQYAVDMVDEHYYRSPDWFASNYHKYDNASRTSHKIYNGEYAVTSDFGTNGTLKAALGEAIYMAGMERNSDVCVMASYAPIFINENEAQWRPDMLHYNAYSSFGTPSYWVQQMMSSTLGHQNLTWTETGNTNDVLHARLAVGSWGTDATYSQVKVTNAEGTVIFEHPEDITSPANTYGIAHIFNTDTYDCTIEMDAVKNSGDEGFLIAFSYADASNYTWWNLGGWGNATHGVEQAVNGSKTTIASADGTIVMGRTYHIKIVRSGLQTKLYLDDKLVNTVTLSDNGGQRLFLCASLNEAEDTAIVKAINYSSEAVPATLAFTDATINGDARLRVMSHVDNYAENSMANPLNVSPKESTLSTTNPSALAYTAPAYSLSVIQIPLANVAAEVAEPIDTDLPAPAVCYGFEGGQPTDDAATLEGTLNGGATVQQFADGNHALYTGPNEEQGYMDLGNQAAQAIGTLLNGEAYSVSLNLLLADGGNLNSFCWAWNINNGTTNYAGLINQPNNLNWYYEQVQSTTSKVSSHAGLCQYKWHNLTITASADATTRLYIDGTLRGSTKSLTTPLILNASTNAWIGRSPFTADAYMTSVFFDDLRIYDQALSAAQVRTLSAEATAKSTECQALQPIIDNKPNAEAQELIAQGRDTDLTSLLANPDFSQGGTGWEGTSFSAAPGTVAEHYYKLFDTYQVLHNMPAGSYRLSWQGFYRNGNIANAYLRHTNGTDTSAEVYANETSTAMLSLYDETDPYTYTPYTYPDNVTTAQSAFAAGHYHQQLEFSLIEMTDLRIGLRSFTPTVYDWACVDNFRLTYLDKETGIKTFMREGDTPDNTIYDLTGRRLQKLPHLRGLYIVGGRKVLF